MYSVQSGALHIEVRRVEQVAGASGQSRDSDRQGRGPLLRLRVADIILASGAFSYLSIFIRQGFDQRNHLMNSRTSRINQTANHVEPPLDFRIPESPEDRAREDRSQA